MTQNGEHKATVNGIVKGRPGKGRVLSLGQRKVCYASHRMDDDNTFRYTPKATKATPNPLERIWCKRCRADSRKRSRVKRLAEAKALALQQRREASAQLDPALPKAKGDQLSAASIDQAENAAKTAPKSPRQAAQGKPTVQQAKRARSLRKAKVAARKAA